MLAWNLNRDVEQARLFEMGAVYEMSAGEAWNQSGVSGSDVCCCESGVAASEILDVSKGNQAPHRRRFADSKGMWRVAGGVCVRRSEV